MQYVSRNPLIPTIQNLSRFTETLRVVGTSNLTKSDDNIKLLRDRDTLNAFLTDIQYLLNESNYNTKKSVINDVKDILESLKLLTVNTNDNNAKQNLKNAFNELSSHITLSTNLLNILSEIENDKLSNSYIEDLFRTLDKSTIYNKQAKYANKIINTAFEKNNKKSKTNKILNRLTIAINSNTSILRNRADKALNIANTTNNKLKQINLAFSKFLSITWKNITVSIKFVTKRLASLSKSISTIVLGIFKFVFNTLFKIVRTLISITNALTSFLTQNALSIITNAISSVWSFLTTPKGIQTLTFITGYIYGRYLKGKIVPYFKKMLEKYKIKNLSLTDILKEKLSDTMKSILDKIKNSETFNCFKTIAESTIKGLNTLGKNLSTSVDNVVNYVKDINDAGLLMSGISLIDSISGGAGSFMQDVNNVLPYTGIISATMAGFAFGGPIGAAVGAAVGIGAEALSAFSRSKIADLQTVNYFMFKGLAEQSIKHQQLIHDIVGEDIRSQMFYSKITNFSKRAMEHLTKNDIKSILFPEQTTDNISGKNTIITKTKDKISKSLDNNSVEANASNAGKLSVLNGLKTDNQLNLQYLSTDSLSKQNYIEGYVTDLTVSKTNSQSAIIDMIPNGSIKDLQMNSNSIFNSAMKTAVSKGLITNTSIGQLNADETKIVKDNMITGYKSYIKSNFGVSDDVLNSNAMKQAISKLVDAQIEEQKILDTNSSYSNTLYTNAIKDLTETSSSTGQASANVSNSLTNGFNIGTAVASSPTLSVPQQYAQATQAITNILDNAQVQLSSQTGIFGKQAANAIKLMSFPGQQASNLLLADTEDQQNLVNVPLIETGIQSEAFMT